MPCVIQPQPRGLSKSMARGGKDYFGDHLKLLLLRVPILLLWFLPPMQPGSHQTSHLHASKPLAEGSGHMTKERGIKECNHWSSRQCDHKLTLKLALGH